MRLSGTPQPLPNSIPENADFWAWLARLRRPQGRKGEILAEILTDFPEKFAERHQLWLLPHNPNPGNLLQAPRLVELENFWLHKGGVVLHFGGVDSISAAEELCGLIVAIPRAERASLEADSAYIGDLVGCELVDLAGPAPVSLGKILSVDRGSGPVDLLVVGGEKGEILVPFAKSYLRSIDLTNKRIEMELPEGLVDLNG